MSILVRVGGAVNPTTLAVALIPKDSAEGVLENVQATANAANRAIGRLLELLVERQHLTIDEACEIVGQHRGVSIWSDRDDDIPF